MQFAICSQQGRRVCTGKVEVEAKINANSRWMGLRKWPLRKFEAGPLESRALFEQARTRAYCYAGAEVKVEAEVKIEFTVCSRQFARALCLHWLFSTRFTSIKAQVAGQRVLLQTRPTESSGRIANWLRYFLQPLIFLFLFLSRKKESQGWG